MGIALFGYFGSTCKRITNSIVVWGLMVCFAFNASADVNTHPLSAQNRLLSEITEKVILPGHTQLTESIQRLKGKAEGFCDPAHTVPYREIRDAWLAAMMAWSAIRQIDFGPIDDTNVGFRFQFWPDPLNLVHRKFRSRVKGANKAIHAESLAGAGAAVQGLTAIEYLLFDAKIGNEEAYRSKPQLCPVLTGTISNLYAHAVEIQRLWEKEYAPVWVSTVPSESNTEQVQRRAESVFSGMVMSLAEIRDLKLGKALSIENAKAYKSNPSAISPNPSQLEAWRSQTSLDLIHTTMAANQKMYAMPKGFSDYLLSKSSDNSVLDQRIKTQFETILAAFKKNQISAVALLQQNDMGPLVELYTQIHDLYLLLKIEYTRASGLQFRFNAKDGD